MKLYVIALAVLFSVAAPVMAADLAATQISSTEMQVDGTGFNPGTVTLLTETSISVTPSGDDYSYELTGIELPAGAVLELDASPVNDDLKLYMKKNWLMVWTFDKSDGSTIGYSYDSSTGNVHVARRVPFRLRFHTIRISGTTAHASVDLNVVVKQDVTADGGGSFSELVDISAIPAGDYMIRAADGANTDTAHTAISAPGDLHRITVTDPETDNLTLDTNGSYTFGATGYDYLGAVVQDAAFTWTSSNTSVGTIDSTGDFEADNAGNTTVYANSGMKESNPVTVHVNPTVITTATPTASSSTASSSGRHSDGGTYPTITSTVTATVAPTAPPTVTPTEAVVPTSTKTAVAEETLTSPVEEAPTKKDIPGFTAMFAITGLLAIAYMVLRQRR
ncbi:MAG: Ig-like domain-containing protein [Euryarchaeota archaeon]|nr:Ig-like domain-containing protein [Euryarchaeota archaeon]